MKKNYKSRVVIDTNLLISATIISSGKPKQLLQLWKNKVYNLIVSSELLEELNYTSQKKKLQKYNLISDNIKALIEFLKRGAEFVTPISPENLSVHSRDSKDDIFLAIAFGGKADYIITGDKDLLVLNGNPALKKLQIISVKQFLLLL